MPRPSTNESLDTSHEIQHRSSSASSMMNSTLPLAPASEHLNSNLSHLASADYPPVSSVRLLPQLSLPATLSDDTALNLLSSTSIQEHSNDTTTSSSHSIPIPRHDSTHVDDGFTSVSAAASPGQKVDSPPMSPIRSWSTLTASVEEKSMQCIEEAIVEPTTTAEERGPDVVAERLLTNSILSDSTARKRKERSDEDPLSPEHSWIEAASR